MNDKKPMDLRFDEFGRLILAGRGAVSLLLLNAIIAATGGSFASPAPPGTIGNSRESQEVRPIPAPDDGPSLGLSDVGEVMRSARSVPGSKINIQCPC